MVNLLKCRSNRLFISLKNYIIYNYYFATQIISNPSMNFYSFQLVREIEDDVCELYNDNVIANTQNQKNLSLIETQPPE